MIKMSDSDGVTTFTLPGQVDSTTAPGVERSMVEGLQPGLRVIIDGSAVTYMSAAGVRALATVLRVAAQQRARVVFCGFAGPAADCLVVAGFSRLLDVVASREEALDRLQTGRAGGAADRLHPRGAAG